MPIGVPSSMASPTMMKLPAIAFSRPPSPPGGGVILVKSAGDRPPRPRRSTSNNIQASQNTPNAMAASDRPRAMRLVHLRRAKSSMESAYRRPFVHLQLGEQPLGKREHQERDEEENEPQLHERGGVQPRIRLREFVREGRGDAVPRQKKRDVLQQVRVADHE